ncbi:MAG: PAS domain S-box protein [Thermoflexaceae bacterium]|nr:PAS domain S-box protein [Thermoflexaceae bacterium]
MERESRRVESPPRPRQARVTLPFRDGYPVMSEQGNDELTCLREELATVRREYEYFLQYMPAMLEADVQTARITYMNRMACILLGFEQADVEAGLDGFSLLDDDGVRMVVEVRARHLASSVGAGRRYEHSPTQELYEVQLRRKDGAWLPVEIQGSYLLDASGSPHRIRFLLRDTSKRNESEEALARSEQTLRTLAENAPVVFVQVNRDGEIVLVEGKGLRALGFEPGQFVGWHIGADEIATTPLGSIYRRAQSGDTVVERVQLAGRILDIRTGPLQNVHGDFDGFVAVATDVTDLDAAGRALVQSQKMESLGILASGIAHDFNNVLTIILSAASVLRRSPLMGPDEQEYLETIHLAARRGADVAGRVLAFARGGETNLSQADLREVIAEVSNLALPSLRRTVSVHTSVPPEPVIVECDRGQLIQALLNMVLNARDAMPGGGEVRLAVNNVGQQAVITVADSGEGMDEATRDRIFQPFFTTKPPGQGTGLGLAVARGIVASHHGAISVQSAPGEGTTFIISLPHRPDNGRRPALWESE